MNITVFNGTEHKGCTFAMKNEFLNAMGGGHEVTEYFFPRDCPVFCGGCKACFFKDISVCPHAKYTVPIWENILQADLLVFTSPTYVFHVTAQLKALLDHYGTKWMAHSPEKPLFSKQAVVITNAAGQGMDKAANDIKDSLDFWGVAQTYIIKQAIFGINWDEVADKRKASVKAQCEKAAYKVKSATNVKPRLKIKALFYVMRMAHKMIDKGEIKAGHGHTRDYLHWEANGWLGGKRPWRDT